MKRHLQYFNLIFIATWIFLSAQNLQAREIININQAWMYAEAPLNGLDINKWSKVNLPHTWNAFDATDNEPGYRRDTSFYFKKLFIPKTPSKSNYILYFEGSNITTRVFVNNKFAGDHVGGYVGFEINISEFVLPGKENEILIAVDNSYNPNIIPSQKADFIIYGGIIRDLWLKIVPDTYLKHSHITPYNISEKSSEIGATIFFNKLLPKSNLKLKSTILDPQGKIISENIQQLPNNQSSIAVRYDKIINPELWSIENPNLYSIKYELSEANKIIDTLHETFGIRWYTFNDYGPFYLNGKRVKLRGTHRHEDYAGYGQALPNDLQRKDIEMIKQMGGNFVRLGHYPQDPEVYKACDELGIIVWDEIPWCRGGMGGDEWKNNTRNQMIEMITQGYNHPSIIFWSIGNEIAWLPDFENGCQKDSLKKMYKEINDLVYSLDSTRLTGARKVDGAAEIVDVYSPSIWAGWYGGVYKGYENALQKSMADYKHFIHLEFGGASVVGRHVEKPITGDGELSSDTWTEVENQFKVKNISNEGDKSESYIVDLFDWYLSVSEKIDSFAGSVQWSMKDFATPIRPEKPLPYMNQKGILDRDGNPKDAFYVFKSYWTENPKFIYIKSHTWTERYGKLDELKEVRLYSNCDSLELFVNGKSQGIKKREYGKFPGHGLQWFVKFNEGENTIIAKDISNKTISDSINVRYYIGEPKNPYSMKISIDTINEKQLLITAKVFDFDGFPCLNHNDKVYFTHLSGDGKLYSNYGVNNKNTVNEFANGKASIIFEPNTNYRDVISIIGGGGKGEFIEIK